MQENTHHTSERVIGILSVLIIAASAAAAGVGILSDAGPGAFTHTSIRGEEIPVYGQGVYQHMSTEVAIQGIAQDWFTLAAVLPLLALITITITSRGSGSRLSLQIVRTGLLAYLFIQYLFYLLMAMYSFLFLLYVCITGTSFFALLLSLQRIDRSALFDRSARYYPRRYIGTTLLVNASAIALLWLSVVLPPLLDGTVYPLQVEHYTTLIVQGMDLSLLLPLAVVSALLVLKRQPSGYLYASVFTVFLSLQMLALSAKIVAMGITGYSLIPAVFIIPAFFVLAGIGTIRIIRSLRERDTLIPHNQ